MPRRIVDSLSAHSVREGVDTVTEPAVRCALWLAMSGLAGDVRVAGSLRYDSCDPYAVSLVFTPHGDEPIAWIFARDLLVEGLHVRTGLADVRVWPEAAGGTICLELSSPSGRAVLRTELTAVEAFLADTQRVVPVGRESLHVDVDAGLAMLLGDSGIAPT